MLIWGHLKIFFKNTDVWNNIPHLSKLYLLKKNILNT